MDDFIDVRKDPWRYEISSSTQERDVIIHALLEKSSHCYFEHSRAMDQL
jgi:hypothetical protein